MYELIWKITVGEFQLFGETIMSTIEWDSFEQTHIWWLLKAEICVRSDFSVTTFLIEVLRRINVNGMLSRIILIYPCKANLNA